MSGLAWSGRLRPSPRGGPWRNEVEYHWGRVRTTGDKTTILLAALIYMYWNEGNHPIAHFHARHASFRASISVDGDVLAGS
ncbi:MAG: DUF4160 domain-containing protein [Candidatus Dormibacteria bacterium]